MVTTDPDTSPDTDETAKVLGFTANAVKVRFHPARQALRTLLVQSFAVTSP